MTLIRNKKAREQYLDLQRQITFAIDDALNQMTNFVQEHFDIWSTHAEYSRLSNIITITDREDWAEYDEWGGDRHYSTPIQDSYAEYTITLDHDPQSQNQTIFINKQYLDCLDRILESYLVDHEDIKISKENLILLQEMFLNLQELQQIARTINSNLDNFTGFEEGEL